MARPIAKDHDEKRGQILRSAAKIFADQGFDRASMNQLALECGVSKANIYHYYVSKDAILFDLLDNYLSGLLDEISTVTKDGDSPEDRLRKTVAAILKAYQGADNEHKVQIGAMGALPEDQQKTLRGYQREMVLGMSRIINDVAPKVFQDDAPKLRATTMSVFGMLNWYYMWNSGAGSKAREDYAELVTNLTLNGIHGI